MSVTTTAQDLVAVLRAQAATRPEAAALTFEGRTTTFGELDRRANQVANGLRAVSPAPEARVAVLAKNSAAFYELLLGAAKARDVLVPINWRLAPPEVAYIVNDARAEILFVAAECFPIVERILADLPTVRRVIALDGHRDGWENYAAWRDAQAAADPALPIAPEDVALQLYTSGTTGHPKGALLTHANFLVALGAYADLFRLTVEDIVLACMPQFHVAGVLPGLFGLFNGARTVVVREPAPAEILRLIPAERVTFAVFVPAVILFLLQTPGCREADFSSLHTVCYGAAPIPLALARDAVATFGCDLVQVYGLTETSGAMTALPARDHTAESDQRLRSCGVPLSVAEIRVVDAWGEPLPTEEVGEIVVRSGLVMQGYWNQPDATAAAIRDGWFHTGDAGYFDADGYLYIYDRVKDMIVSGGENIYPAEVESALYGHPAVADVGVIGVPDDRWGESVKAVVVLKPGAAATAEELVAYCRERIAHYKAPKTVDFVDALPRNPSGKILKRVLREPYWAGQ
ncbi:MAG TPA: fatty acid--CoA ligase, partial [Thermomicrobiales bacterium]|nr:fatty acid--CoA ligase [Thermomicrobiales bacterium]